MVKITNHHHQSSVIPSHAIFITYILSEAKGVVILNMVDNDNSRLNAQFLVKTLESLVHLVNYRL